MSAQKSGRKTFNKFPIYNIESVVDQYYMGMQLKGPRCISTRRDTNNSHDKNKTTTIIMNESFHTTSVKRQT